MGKIVLIVDKTVAPDYNLYPDCSQCGQLVTSRKCYNLDNYANMIAGSKYLRTAKFNNLLDQTATPYNINDDDITTDIDILKIAIPGVDTLNPDFIPFISNYSVQIIGFQFYKNDAYLTSYEELFSNKKSAFVSMASVYIAISTQSTDLAIDRVNSLYT